MTTDQIAAIRAGLRLLQTMEELPPDIADVYTSNGTSAGLTNDELEQLVFDIQYGV